MQQRSTAKIERSHSKWMSRSKIQPHILWILKSDKLQQLYETSVVQISDWVPEVIAVVSVGVFQDSDVNTIQTLRSKYLKNQQHTVNHTGSYSVDNNTSTAKAVLSIKTLSGNLGHPAY